MKWYCKFCRLFLEVDLDRVCNNCQHNKSIFKYIGNVTVVDDTVSEESTIVDRLKEN